MQLELDHIFLCTSVGAPEGDKFIEFGFREGTPNRHPGQGTANRRFPFANAMIELLWVENELEARNERTRPTMLWERWSGRGSRASPFGICMRPTDSANGEAPFSAWTYKPEYLPDPLVMHIGYAGLDEPMWVYLEFMRRGHRQQVFSDHPNGLREITGLTLTAQLPLRSNAASVAIQNGVLCRREGKPCFLEIEFDHRKQQSSLDCRPAMPVVLHY